MFHGPVFDLNQLFQTIRSIYIQYVYTTANQTIIKINDQKQLASITKMCKKCCSFSLFQCSSVHSSHNLNMLSNA